MAQSIEHSVGRAAQFAISFGALGALSTRIADGGLQGRPAYSRASSWRSPCSPSGSSESWPLPGDDIRQPRSPRAAPDAAPWGEGAPEQRGPHAYCNPSSAPGALEVADPPRRSSAHSPSWGHSPRPEHTSTSRSVSLAPSGGRLLRFPQTLRMGASALASAKSACPGAGRTVCPSESRVTVDICPALRPSRVGAYMVSASMRSNRGEGRRWCPALLPQMPSRCWYGPSSAATVAAVFP